MGLFGKDKRNAAAATVVLSRVPPEEPAWREAGEALIGALKNGAVAFRQVDSVYDRHEDDPDIAWLRAIPGDLIFLGWHYPRALKWILARQGLEVNGKTRKLHCLDVRERKPEALAAEVKAILKGAESAVVQAPPPKDEPPGGLTPRQRGQQAEARLPNPENAARSPRWYPVVDHDACTNCMECLDFCLFGVYGVDREENLRVVQPDQCRTDCPACSRVCPVGAIIFPKYRTNASIAGGEDGGERGSLKLDLSKIFGKPKARHQAALERDRELIKAGRKPASAEKVEQLAAAFERIEI